MATYNPPASETATSASPTDTDRNVDSAWRAMQTVLGPLASLKLTIVLMALAIAIIFIGTLAQTEMDIWEVMHKYFRAWFVLVPLRVFFPKSFFPPATFTPPGGVLPFPGGATIGILMVVNLLAAHLVRFKMQAKGNMMWAGWGVIAFATFLSLAVVTSGNSTGVQDRPWLSWQMMWYGVLLVLTLICGGCWLGAAALLVQVRTGVQQLLCLALSLGAVVTSAMLVYAVLYPQDARLSDSSLRIMWQVSQGGIAAVVMLVGCWLVFKQRAGIVIMHGGIALLMLGEALVAWYAVESQISLHEGETANFSRDIRTTELAFIDSSDKEKDDVIVVRRQALENAAANSSTIRHADLPVEIVVQSYLPNATLRELKPGETSVANQGLGKTWLAEKKQASAGTDMDSKVDFAAAYVQLKDKATGSDLGTYLCSVMATEVDEPEKVTIGDKTYQLALRFKHIYKDYQVTLKDVEKRDYPGTNVPRDYSSYLVLEDKARNVHLEPHIWMNNPLRYGGETFYQSGYNVDRLGESTSLQVVSNTGWMLPYVALTFVMVGMLYHFVLALIRFVGRETRTPVVANGQTVPPSKSATKGSRPVANPQPTHDVPQPEFSPTAFIAPAIVAVLFFAFLYSVVREKKLKSGEFDYAAFAALPIVDGGRVKPIDTLARNSLKIISNEETYKDDKGKRQPAIRWFLEVIAGKSDALKHAVFRIEHPEVITLFGQESRPGSFRYSAEELQKKIGDFQKAVDNAEKKDRAELTVFERKVLELNSRLKQYMLLSATFDPPAIPKPPTPEVVQKDRNRLMAWMAEFRNVAEENQRRVDAMKLPLVIPLADASKAKSTLARDGWQAYPTAYLGAFVQSQIMGEEPDDGVLLFNKMLEAYSNDKVDDFNKSVAEYQHRIIDARNPSFYSASKIRFERFFNHFMPFFWGIWIYFAAQVLALFAVLFQWNTIRRATLTLLVLVFLLHTYALVGRIWISGRPPVTNLYSSAVFIGWGCVLMGLVLEVIAKNGLGNFVSSVAGFLTLEIAWYLSLDGDTFTVLQAVLDTQIWLATHVTSITLGYSATFLAGLLGTVLIALSFNPRKDVDAVLRLPGIMIYGTLCFALFFSFVGTVLGGLWADDSWGRFWGWDPKENGALMIVLWNALVLHARWDRLIGDRGLAILAVFGNIVTAWSWFGVNELGVGLHSYGFTEGRLKMLGIAILVHFLIMLAGIVSVQLMPFITGANASPREKQAKA